MKSSGVRALRRQDEGRPTLRAVKAAAVDRILRMRTKYARLIFEDSNGFLPCKVSIVNTVKTTSQNRSGVLEEIIGHTTRVFLNF
jgi:hypothetical protein